MRKNYQYIPVAQELVEPNDEVFFFRRHVTSLDIRSQIIQPPQSAALTTSFKACNQATHQHQFNSSSLKPFSSFLWYIFCSIYLLQLPAFFGMPLHFPSPWTLIYSTRSSSSMAVQAPLFIPSLLQQGPLPIFTTHYSLYNCTHFNSCRR